MIMEDIDNYIGYLLAAHPKRQDPVLRRGVILVIDNDHSGAIGLQINKPMENQTSLGRIMMSLGISYDKDNHVYFGGPENTNRIIVLHSLDWKSTGTTCLGSNFGISNDISVLAAIASDNGPQHFRAIAGVYRWLPGHFESELDGTPPFNEIGRRWSHVPASLDLIFGHDGLTQWHNLIEEHAKTLISSWF
jgi:putative transcriptional regulator